MEYSFIKLNTARNALRYIIRAYNIKEIYVPYYLCFCIRNSIRKENCKINYYHIDLNFNPQLKVSNESFILYPNYFGICDKIVEELSQEYKNLIVDNAHSFFSKPRGIASFNSLRKFFSILRDGSFLYIKNNRELEIVKDDYSYDLKNLTYTEMCKNEYRLDYEEIKTMSDCTLKAFENIDLNVIKENKRKSYKFWHEKLKKSNLIDFDIENKDVVPFCYPYFVKDKKIVECFVNQYKNFQLYRYWNNMPDSFVEKNFYTKLICIN